MQLVVLALATVTAFGLSTAAFAENLPRRLPSHRRRISPAQSQAPVAHKMRASHRAGAKKVVRRQTLHRRASHARHYGHDHGKWVAVKHMPAKKTVMTKTAS